VDRLEAGLHGAVKKQDRLQCTYNVTMRRVRATIVAVEEQYILCILNVSL